MKQSSEIYCQSAEIAEKVLGYALTSVNSFEAPFVKDVTCEGRVVKVEYEEVGVMEDDPSQGFDDRLIGYRDGWEAAHKALVPGALPLNEHTRWILGRPNFTLIGMAQSLRLMGHEIPTKAEDEQAACIRWMLNMYFKHGDKWRDEATQYFKDGRAELKAASKTSEK